MGKSYDQITVWVLIGTLLGPYWDLIDPPPPPHQPNKRCLGNYLVDSKPNHLQKTTNWSEASTWQKDINSKNQEWSFMIQTVSCFCWFCVFFCFLLEFNLEAIRISTAMSRSILKVVLNLKCAFWGQSYDQNTVWVGGMSRKASKSAAGSRLAARIRRVR